MTGPTHDVFVKAAATISAWRRPLLVSHTRPDGDALGSLAALRGMLQSQGAEPLALLFDPIPAGYAIFQRHDPMPVLGRDMNHADLAAVDGIVLLDTCTYSQLDPIADWLRTADQPKLAVDHHVNRDDLADSYVVDESAAATCLILYDWANVAGWSMDALTREALFIGMATDTGWFQYSNTDGRVLKAAADFASRGLEPHDLHQELFQHVSPGRVRLMGTALSSLELLADGRLAVMTLTKDDFRAAGAEPGDTENVVNEPLRIESVLVSVLLVDQDDGRIRTSFRSKPPADKSRPDVDVSSIAQTFGGGGHRRAAGARPKASLPEVRDAVVQRIKQRFTV